jgi:hypothetical protein
MVLLAPMLPCTHSRRLNAPGGRFRPQVALALAAALAAIACSSGSSQFYNHCTKDSECLPAAVCIDNLCATECTANNQCPLGLKCVYYRCIDPTPDAGPRQTDSGQPDAGGPQPEVDADAATPDTAPPEEVSGPPDTGPEILPDIPEQDALPPGCEPVAGPYGAACSCVEECESGLCVQNKLINAAICTQYCLNDAQCPGPDVCIPVDATAVCLPNDSGQPASCDPGQAICYKQLFLKNKLGQCVCTADCVTALDCPEGFACHVLGAQKVCVSVGQVCATGYVPCFGECAGNPQTGQGFCTAICVSSADCPDTWKCTPIPDGVSVCNPS